jgi:multicomponent Na+:H+ antiporter subunit G
VFLLFTNPLSSQVLARAAHRTGARKSSATVVDHLEDDLGERS